VLHEVLGSNPNNAKLKQFLITSLTMNPVDIMHNKINREQKDKHSMTSLVGDTYKKLNFSERVEWDFPGAES
jgi:hypothetical protein